MLLIVHTAAHNKLSWNSWGKLLVIIGFFSSKSETLYLLLHADCGSTSKLTFSRVEFHGGRLIIGYILLLWDFTFLWKAYALCTVKAITFLQFYLVPGASEGSEVLTELNTILDYLLGSSHGWSVSRFSLEINLI